MANMEKSKNFPCIVCTSNLTPPGLKKGKKLNVMSIKLKFLFHRGRKDFFLSIESPNQFLVLCD